MPQRTGLGAGGGYEQTHYEDGSSSPSFDELMARMTGRRAPLTPYNLAIQNLFALMQSANQMQQSPVNGLPGLFGGGQAAPSVPIQYVTPYSYREPYPGSFYESIPNTSPWAQPGSYPADPTVPMGIAARPSVPPPAFFASPSPQMSGPSASAGAHSLVRRGR